MKALKNALFGAGVVLAILSACAVGVVFSVWASGGTFGHKCAKAGYVPDTAPFVECLKRLSVGGPVVLKELP